MENICCCCVVGYINEPANGRVRVNVCERRKELYALSLSLSLMHAAHTHTHALSLDGVFHVDDVRVFSLSSA